MLELSPDGSKACAQYIDVTDPDQMQNLVDESISKFGHINYFFNNAGATICGEVRDISLSDWRKVLDINLRETDGLRKRFHTQPSP